VEEQKSNASSTFRSGDDKRPIYFHPGVTWFGGALIVGLLGAGVICTLAELPRREVIATLCFWAAQRLSQLGLG